MKAGTCTEDGQHPQRPSAPPVANEPVPLMNLYPVVPQTQTNVPYKQQTYIASFQPVAVVSDGALPADYQQQQGNRPDAVQPGFSRYNTFDNAPQPNPQSGPTFRKLPDWATAVIMILLPVVGGLIIGLVFSADIYQNIETPWWSPPGWLFAPVWTLLYTAMGVASWLVYRSTPSTRDLWPPLFLYALQLAVNWIWSPIFFGAGQFGGALMDISALLALIVSCIAVFWNHSPIAAGLMVPYLAWICFASALNYSIVCLNGCVYHNGTHVVYQ